MSCNIHSFPPLVSLAAACRNDGVEGHCSVQTVCYVYCDSKAKGNIAMRWCKVSTPSIICISSNISELSRVSRDGWWLHSSAGFTFWQVGVLWLATTAWECPYYMLKMSGMLTGPQILEIPVVGMAKGEKTRRRCEELVSAAVATLTPSSSFS